MDRPQPYGNPQARGHQPLTPISSLPDLRLAHLLKLMLEQGASDLHVPVNTPIMVRVHGRMQPLEFRGHRLIGDPEQIYNLLVDVLNDRQRDVIDGTHDLDFAYEPEGLGARFRCNYMFAQSASSPSALNAVFRVIPTDVKTIDQLGLPDVIRRMCLYPRGLVLVTGPTGSGKSTTLAAMIDEINRNRACHIITIEDPVEFVHRPKQSLIRHREVGEDTTTFASALRAALRQDPDVILVGEMRDPETIQLAITAAETGHLVFATLHAQDASQTVDRIVDAFDGAEQAQIKAQLGMTIQGIIAQQLAATADGAGRRVVMEILTASDAVRNCIREGKTPQIYSAIQTSSNLGMQTMEQHLADLVAAQAITHKAAKMLAGRPAELDRALASRMSGGGTS